MKNIAILINSLSDGGAEQVVKIILENCLKQNFKIELICLEKNTLLQLNKNIKVTYLVENKQNINNVSKLLNLPFLAYKLYKYIKKENIELIQSHLFRANYVAILASRLFKSKHINQIVNHTLISTFYKNDIVGIINKFLIRKLFPMADLIISVSKIVKEDTVNICHLSNLNIVIYNPFDIENIERSMIEVLDEFYFNETKQYIICVGRLVEIKKYHNVIYSLQQLDESIELIILGDGEEKNTLINLSKELSISNRVHFLGTVNNPFKYIYKSNILIVSSQSESFANVIVESFICKTPVISTKCGGPSELIKNNENGILIDINNIEQLTRSINTLLDNKILSNKYTNNAYMKVKDFNLQKIITQYIDILRLKT